MKAGWTYKKLADLCTFFGDGDWIESKDQSSNGIRLIQTGNVGEGVFKDRGDKARYINEETFDRLRCTEIFEGDCLISRLPDPVGRSAILPDTGERMITAVDCTIVRFNHQLCLPEFFNYYSQSIEYINNVSERCTGTTRNRISRSQLGKTQIPTSDVGEQRRIVTLLDEAFADIATAKANAEKNLQNARDLLESHLQAAFTQQADWELKAFGELAEFRNGINFNKSSKGNEIKIVGVRDFQKNFWAPLEDLETIIPDGEIPATDLIESGDLLFVRSNGNPELIGRTLLIGDLNERITHSGFTIKARLHHTELSPIYLCHYLKSGLLRREMIEGGNGANIKSLNQGTLSRLKIAFPDKSKQLLIVEHLETVQAEIAELESIYRQKLTALDDLKKSLLHQAFSGQL